MRIFVESPPSRTENARGAHLATGGAGMLIAFNCPGCAAKLSVKDSARGRVVPCPRCGERIDVPHARTVLMPKTTLEMPEPEPMPPLELVEPPRSRLKRDTTETLGLGALIWGILSVPLAIAGPLAYIVVVFAGLGLLLSLLAFVLTLVRGHNFSYGLIAALLNALSLALAIAWISGVPLLLWR